jgi:hypothetical protein
MSTLRIPLGRAKGKLIDRCAVVDLEWALGLIEDRLCAGKPYDFEASDKRWAPEAAQVLKRRKSAGDLDEHPDALEGAEVRGQTQALATAPRVSIVEALSKVTLGALNDAKAASEALAKAAEFGHLISPQTTVGTLPEGCSLMVSGVVVDKSRETYRSGNSDELGLGKVALDKIAAAAGVDWLHEHCKRTDDGKKAFYRSCQAVGRVSNFDGSWRTRSAHKEIDMSDTGQDYLDIVNREANNKRSKKDYSGDGGAKEIAVKRKHILSLCDTEAHLRCIRALVGLRVSYLPDELEKPFVVVKLMFDGRSSNPETQAYFDRRIADRFLGASEAVYGPRVQRAQPRIIELPTEGEPEYDLPDYGFVELPQTGTGGRR